MHADNVRSVNAFLAVRTQWQHAGLAGQRTGLNYHGVAAWLDLNHPRRRRRALMEDLQIMEHAVLAADREQRDDKNKSE